MGILKRINKDQQPQGQVSSTPPGMPTAPSARPASEEPSRLDSLRSRRMPSGIGTGTSSYADLRNRVQQMLLSELDPRDDPRSPETQQRILEVFNTILQDEAITLSKTEKEQLYKQVVSEILGFGPLEPLLADESITEIMVNGPKNVYIERRGKLERATVVFENDDHVLRVLDRIVSPLGRRIDESSPMVDARLPDGSRVNAVIRPLAIDGPTITIRKFSKKPLTIEDLIRFGSLTKEIAEFLAACVQARLNMIVSGGTGSGKTTLLNVLSNFIPGDERIVTIENAAELQLQQEHVVRLESRPPNIEGKGEVTIRDLVINSLRMRPDRIVVGECRGGEALDMLQAMNTGHDGSLTTAHANTPRDCIARLETMCLMAGMDLPVRAIREQIAAAVDVICQQERLRDGKRKVVKITEVQGMEGEVITMSDIFEFEQTGIEGGQVIGRIRPTGLRPKFIDRIEAVGIHLPPSVFGIGSGMRY
ncbi:MAG: type II secretion system protein E [Candidatus Thermofonsia Clade 1 bacterium]|jgi:pilus assembly protein CpaF|uniref:Type II secretion system protein E n=1 Tax=Candidatus Thermofonsia Clade 1 bacterium TaxID=2364210 RepID=A0A2M8Q0R2_9CHLR|nr:MAG: type II secretion system protein E [Candidatus Thermofonsia Clade 1 bacterium]PJF43378.1 MAG: type II secretion system protein E [Candidatus Thermofonsia Clade 1 bacterium]RMF50578.1 MAG: CpaF family protein [Chloroflexota bacterium]